MSPRDGFDLLKATYTDWSEDKASRLAAALAYYTAFSIAPLLLIAIAVAGLVFGEEAASGAVSAQLEGLLGSEAAGAVETGIQNARQPGIGTLSAVVGLGLLLWSASNVFAQLQDALNTIWEVAPKPGRGILATIRTRLLSMTMVLGVAFMLLVSLVLSAALTTVGRFFSGLLPGGEAVWQVVNFGLSLVVIALLFAAIYKVLPDAEVAWGDVWIGAAATAVLFTVGKLLIGLYLGHASVGSSYGAAGSLMVLLLWVYYSAQLLFFGAEFTQAYARRYGSRIVPTEDAVGLTPEARAQQGMPRRGDLEGASEAAPTAPAGATQPPPAGAAVGPATRDGATQPHRAGAAPARPGRDGRTAPARSSGSLKKVLWAGLASGSVGLAGVLAHRASAAIWRAVLREPPPIKTS